ncbi:MAG: excinuclease ABC subunit A [Dehalococcoidaceae bacterium]|nr:excinuclease ABC subunit A [Dehalococcoidaceae bacterium]
MAKKAENTNKNIIIKGAKLHNLKDISLSIPKDKMVVISGVSGSGKSTLAFDTLFAEGQRRYIESLSSYARQFLGKLQKPDVDEITGICPAIAIEQKVISKNPRSTVGTTTEINDYLKLLFARIGKTYSPISRKEVKKDSVSDVCDFILKQAKNSKCVILANYKNINRNGILSVLQQQGFSRVRIEGKINKIQTLIAEDVKVKQEDVWVVIDRLINEDNEDNINRISDSVQTAFYEGDGECLIEIEGKDYAFSNRFELDGMEFEKPSTHLFSFNNPYGACKKCEGFGSILGIDENKVVPNKTLSVFQGAISCWKGEKLAKWKDRFILRANQFDFPIHRPYNELNKDELEIVWNGKEKCKGVNQFFSKLESDKYKIQNRVLIARYRGKTKCTACGGSRLRKDAEYVKIKNTSFSEITNMSIENALQFFNKLKLNEVEMQIAERLTMEISNRLTFLVNVGLSYLTLARPSNSLSGGESQRINLATSLGSSLIGSMYILDEPSIGLHPNDTQKLIKVLHQLRDIKNTVIVVEHDEEIMESADQIIDLGPEAGRNGGELVYQGELKNIGESASSLTGKYLAGNIEIPTPEKRRNWNDKITLSGINQHNLQNIDVEFPLNCLTLICGVSGSGKTSLIKQVLYPAIANKFGIYGKKSGSFKQLTISTEQLKSVEFIDQNPIGRSSRSNPVTYIKAFDDIRNLFAGLTLSKSRNYKSGFFSFNVDGGRCEHCHGEGEVTVEMQFMADVHLLCEHCKGQRYKEEILEVKFHDKNIADILSLTIDEAIAFFSAHDAEKITAKLLPLQKVGLNYLALGQSSNTLSGGEAQRIKLASFLGKGDSAEKVLFIFDEPTTGLHFHDINKLLNSFYALIEKGHSIICIEHNMDVIKCADWIIDLGPEGGDKGGKVMFAGSPEDLVKNKKSLTAKYLRKKLS